MWFKIHCLVDSKSNYLYDAIISQRENNKNFILTNSEYSYIKNIILIII